MDQSPLSNGTRSLCSRIGRVDSLNIQARADTLPYLGQFLCVVADNIVYAENVCSSSFRVSDDKCPKTRNVAILQYCRGFIELTTRNYLCA